MKVALWILQVLLALHTAMGGLWKFSHSAEETMASLKAIPGGAWLAMAVLELVCAVCLVLPAWSRVPRQVAAFAALFIVAEMLLFTVLHLLAHGAGMGSIAYWGVVAACCAFIAWGNLRTPA